MNVIIDDLTLIFPEQVIIEFSQETKEKAWQQITKQDYAHQAVRWNVYINQLCLNIFTAYLKEAHISSKIVNEKELLSFWQLVNGTAVEIEQTRLVLIGSDRTLDELRVPKEWVDLPGWAGNYYLFLELNLEAGWLWVRGYATYEQLKEEARCDRLDQTYVLDVQDLNTDLTVLWTVLEIAPSLPPQVEPIPTLSSSDAEALIAGLSQSATYSPRLDLPFEDWGALIAQDRHRHALYKRRQSSVAAQNQISINLQQWLRDIFQAGWQSLQLLDSETRLAYSFRSQLEEDAVEGVKRIDLGMLGHHSVAILVSVTLETDQKASIRVQLHPTEKQTYLPPDIKIALLSGSGKILQEVVARKQDNFIQLKRFTCPTSKNFKIRVSLQDFSLTENFIA